ncbi:MAG: DNA/RNA helicase, partial [bacterium]|nr:DNA/RNA helicase [bacterium]
IWYIKSELGSGAILSLFVPVTWLVRLCESDSAPTLYAPDYDIDSNPAVDELVLPADADSSQQSALVDIRAGRNLVIEGPPGTGKSQTITNAIADAIGAGKRVLFVAEKLAALQVVHDRLASLGLTDFCLELHSDGATPRHVFESFKERLARTYQSPAEIHETREFLRGSRDLLNKYVAQMGMEVGPDRQPLYDILWRIVSLRNQAAVFRRDCVQKIPDTGQVFRQAIQKLGILSQVLIEHPDPKASRWWGFFPFGLAFRQTDQIESGLAEIADASTRLARLIRELAEAWDASPIEVDHICSSIDPKVLRELLQNVPRLVPQFARHLLDAHIRKLCDRLLQLIEERNQYISQFRLKFQTNPAELTTLAKSLRDLTTADGLRPDTTLEQIDAFNTWLRDLEDAVAATISIVRVLSSVGLEPRNALDDLERCIKLVQLSQHSVVGDSSVVTEHLFEATGIQTLRAAYRESKRLQQL